MHTCGECKHFDDSASENCRTKEHWSLGSNDPVNQCHSFELKNQDKPKHFGHPMFYQLLDQMAELHSRKNHDYAGVQDPLKNLKASERLGVNSFVGVLVRLQDKWSRIEQFAKTGELLVKDEAVEDTLMDNAVYSLLAIILRREQKNANSSRS